MSLIIFALSNLRQTAPLAVLRTTLASTPRETGHVVAQRGSSACHQEEQGTSFSRDLDASVSLSGHEQRRQGKLPVTSVLTGAALLDRSCADQWEARQTLRNTMERGWLPSGGVLLSPVLWEAACAESRMHRMQEQQAAADMAPLYGTGDRHATRIGMFDASRASCSSSVWAAVAPWMVQQLPCMHELLPGTPLEAPGIAPPPFDPALDCGKRGATYQPSRRKRINSHGLEKRLSTPGGRNTLMRRLQKKRSRLTVDCFV